MDFIFDFMEPEIFASIVLAFLFGIMLIQGVPISVAIAVSSIITAAFFIPIDTAFFVATQKMYSGIDSFTLLALPFFILSGNIMNKGGIALRLVNLAKYIGGGLPGYLAHTNVIANMLFGSLSGSSVAAAAAVGGVMGPLEEKEGYDPVFSATVNICSAPSGVIIPPSGPLILFSLVSGGTSVAALFIGGYVPGILMGLAIMVVTYFLAKRRGYVGAREQGQNGLKIIFDAIPSLLMIVVVIGGIIIGAFTATEGAAVAAVYSFALSLIYRLATPREYWDVLKSTTVTSATILFLIAASGIMSYTMTITGIPEAVSEGLLYFSHPLAILLVMNIILLIVGTFMDLTPAVLIFTPIFMPIARQIGMDPVHFGIMMIYNMAIGSVTPPVGSVLFVGCSVSKVTIEQVTRVLPPFLIALTICLILVIYVPSLSLFLPRAFGLM
ncbi:MAG: TRAP transporter large permease [Planctomycetaceae bacterium]|nr:TRAP transporter large permease [Planctomycetaceae bacterium]